MGLGAKAVFGIRDFFGIGTAANFFWNQYNIDMAVVGADNTSMSAVFVNNRNFTFNVPVFVSFRFNVAHSVRWNVDGDSIIPSDLPAVRNRRYIELKSMR